ncbi:tyrosine-type recombinase/integrase [Zobellella taiwanensis]
MKYYIDNIRSSYHRSSEHDFIFISEKNSRNTAGLPLTIKSINAIFERISKAINFHVHPHLLRHKWNEIFDKNGSSLGIDAEELEDIRKYAMGWSQNSKMNQIYNDRRLAEKAYKISMHHQNEINKK